MDSSEKKILIPAYYFPPLGMGGVQRILKFVKYLPEYNWIPTVITVKNVKYHASDKSLLDEIGETEIYRTGSFDPLRLSAILLKNRDNQNVNIRSGRTSGILQWLLRLFCIPDTKIGWVPFARRYAARLVRKGQYEAVLTSSPPLSGHLVGLKLKQKLDLKWIADFRDYWQDEPERREPTFMHRFVKQRIIAKILTNADLVISVSAPITDSLKSEFSSLDPEKFITLPNGFDPDDFQSEHNRNNDSFIISYCGTLTPHLNPALFFQVVQTALARCPELAKKIRIRMAGSVNGINLNDMINRYDLSQYIELKGYVSHKQSVKYLLESDILLFLLSDQYSPGMVTGKLYEYLAAGKPIFVFAGRGEAEEIIRKYSGDPLFCKDDIAKAVTQLISWFELWKDGRLRRARPVLSELGIFNRKKQTEQLAGFLDKLI